MIGIPFASVIVTIGTMINLFLLYGEGGIPDFLLSVYHSG